ncbi:MAG: VOC family protein [Ferruginibacter sp.]
MLQKSVPILPSLNIIDTIDFYEAKLGFAAINYGNYAILRYENTEIHLAMTNSKVHPVAGTCLIMVDNIEDLYTRLSSKGLVHLTGQLSDKPWGNKEFTIIDNNKNLIRFGQKR